MNITRTQDSRHQAIQQFEVERDARIASYPSNADWIKTSHHWLTLAFRNQYMYNFEILGRPVIQTPADILALQEIIWATKPDLVIETGVAHGGSVILSASMLSQLDICDAIEAGGVFNPAQSHRKVIGIDIDIREHNRLAIEEHPMASRIQLIQGSSIAADVIEQVKGIATSHSKVLVCLDSNHTHEHVLEELKAYAPLVTRGSYCIVFDTIVEDLPQDMFPDRVWGPGNNPKTAVWEFLSNHPEFEIDKALEAKLMLTVAPDGYLKRVS